MKVRSLHKSYGDKKRYNDLDETTVGLREPTVHAQAGLNLGRN
jgi:hypothetical protein